MRQGIQIFAVVYVLGCKLSLVRICNSDFGITPSDDITIGITCAAFCFHMAHISLLLLLLLLLLLHMLCSDRLCGLVVRVSGYRYRGPGFDPRRYQIF